MIDIMHYVYFAKSLRNEKVYVGQTQKSPEERIKEHNQGSSTWTRSNGPFELIYYEEYMCREDAIRRESFYKMGFGKKIKKLIVENLKLKHTKDA